MTKKTGHNKKLSADEETKPAYQSPTLVPLGELAKGSGKCAPGTSGTADPNDCSTGTGVK